MGAARLLSVGIALALFGGLLPALVGQAPAAQAATGQFQPGFIISDQVFYNAGTMTPPSIQSFLIAKGASCRQAAGGPPCLKDYAQDTGARAPDSLCPGGYQSGTGENAATIIWKVSQACGINPQVLLVMLQKEQGLVGSSSPAQYSYDSAMGQGCPDTAACSSYYSGFFNQVYSSASQFQRYRLYPNSYAYRPYVTNNILFNPNSACGTSPVLIQNQATAGLYNYTPYQPNAAALAAGFGYGDSCSAYGNRNFYNYFNTWFGTTGSNTPPIGNVDSATFTGNGVITVRGWTLDPDATTSLFADVYVDGVGVRWEANQSRPDVGAAFGKGDLHGFSGSVQVGPGSHQVCVFGIDSVGGPNSLLNCQTVANAPPIGVVEQAWVSTPGVISVAGWTLDRDSNAPLAADVYVDGVGVRWQANQSRPDVAAAFGKGDLHGFSGSVKVSPGPHQVCVFGIDSVGGPNTLLNCQTVTNDVPIGVVEQARVSAPGVISVAGWTLDPNTSAPLAADVYVDGVGVRWQADQSRPDVAAAYPGKGGSHGFSGSVNVSPGSHQVCVFGIDSVGGPNTLLNCQTVTNDVPIGVVDAVGVTSPGVISVAGWALDPNTSASIPVHVYVDGVGVPWEANQFRPDIAAAYPGKGDRHGFSGSVMVASGSHRVCAYAIDSVGGPNTLLRCENVTS